MVTKRIGKNVAAFVDPGPLADLIRLDGRKWRDAIGEALDLATDQRKRSDEVRLAIAQILWLADKCDEIGKEIFTN